MINYIDNMSSEPTNETNGLFSLIVCEVKVNLRLQHNGSKGEC